MNSKNIFFKLDSVSLCFNSHCSKTNNSKMLSPNPMHTSELSHFFQSAACHNWKN